MLLLVIWQVHVARSQQQHLFSRPFHPATEKASVNFFLTDINMRSGIIIEYASHLIDTGRIITLSESPSTLGALLQQVLQGQRIRVIERNNKLLLIAAPTPLPENAFQVTYAVYGIIKDDASGEPLVDANIWEASRRKGSYTNQHGYFTLTLPAGKQMLTVSYAGYVARQIAVDLQENVHMDFRLIAKSEIPDVTILAENRPKAEDAIKVNDNEYGGVSSSDDLMRSLYMLPGVKNIMDLPSGLMVRGGNPGENIFLLDGNPVFNPTHLLGTLPIVNQTSLKTMYLYRSNFPARYGGGLSSVLDVATKDGNMKQWKGEANAGFLAGSLTIEGPLKKDKTAMMLSFRHSWVNPLLRLFKADFGVNFYDLHVKVTHLLNKKDKLMLNVYAGDDDLVMRHKHTNNRQQWGNKTFSLAWNRILGPHAFLNTSVSATSYNNIAGFRFALYDSTGALAHNRVYNIFSSITQFTGQSQLELTPTPSFRMNIGARVSHTRIKPFNRKVSNAFLDDPDAFKNFPALSYREYILFYENQIRLGSKFVFSPGFHWSVYDYSGFTYNALQPRVHAVYRLNRYSRFTASISRMTQYLHLVTNPYLGVNSDAWVPSTQKLKPEDSRMVNLGYQYADNKKFFFNVDLYYKAMRQVTNYVEGKNIFLNNATWEYAIQSGKGWSYGMETMISKQTKKWKTMLGYTLSWNYRKFEFVNQGKKFPFKYDRRHDLSAAVSYLHNRWEFSALWKASTGDVFTIPGRVYPDFDDAQGINDPKSDEAYRLIYQPPAIKYFRTPYYHRLDLMASYQHVLNKNLKARLTLGVYNVYGSPSQYVYDLKGKVGKSSLTVTSQYEVLSMLPYITYTVQF